MKCKNVYFSIFLFALITSTCYRITMGIDLTDEAYYATYIDGWLKQGLQNSKNLGLHQTAALLVFPFAYVYQNLIGTEIGLILFLRGIYLVISLCAMATLFCFLERLKGQLVAVLVFGFGFLFIPFSLPAPSYNTIAMFGVIAAISLFGIALLNLSQGKRLTIAIISSALSWIFVVIAYPSLMTVFGVFICFAYILLRSVNERAFILRYVLICIFFQICGFALLFLVFGTEYWIQVFQFSTSIFNMGEKVPTIIYKTKNLFFNNKIFTISCIVALFSGIALSLLRSRDRLVLVPILVLIGILLYAVWFNSAALFFQSHDIITLIALFGIFIPLSHIFQPKQNAIPPLISVMYCSSMFAGLVTAGTATQGFFNFPIGGLLASCLSLAFIPWLSSTLRVMHITLLIVINIMMVILPYKFIYGEAHGNLFDVPVARIKGGVFAGLLTSIEQKAIIDKITEMLPQEPTGDKKIVILGPIPAAYLLTSFVPSTLTTTWVGAKVGSQAGDMVKRFYQKELNRPDLIFQYITPWAEPLTVIEEELITKYQIIKRETISGRVFLLYEKN